MSVPTHGEVMSSSGDTSEDEPESTAAPQFDPANTRHKGQYALRKLYHESDRLITVRATSVRCCSYYWIAWSVGTLR